MTLFNGDCLEIMKTLEDKSVDLFICDLPYGETNCKWDCKIDMVEFWKEFKRLRKSKRTACIHFCSTKFGYSLIKSWEKGFKMDMVWKKRNKTGGLQSRHRPMRNHEMIYFFYEQAPKYNRDKYHKRIKSFPSKKENGKDPFGNDNIGVTVKESGFACNFVPPNPASVVEQDNRINENNKSSVGWDIKYMDKPRVAHFEPKLPASVVEEADANKATIYNDRVKGNKDEFGYDAEFNIKPFKNQFDPKLPASVIEEEQNPLCYHQKKFKDGGHCGRLNKDGSYKMPYDPPNPASVVEEDEPKSMFESTKVFIGKRHHQTEKPQDILEFFLKYWTDEDDTVLDPTMGSGSTGVACAKLNRKFIGIELDEVIYKVAEKRIIKII